MPQSQLSLLEATHPLYLDSQKEASLLQPVLLTASDYNVSMAPSEALEDDCYSQGLVYLCSPESTLSTSSFPDKRKWADTFSTTDDEHIAKTDDSFSTYSQDDSHPNESDEDGSQSSSGRGKRRGPKPMADTDLFESSNDPRIKRKAQNRAAQRAFRERKERYVKELEIRIRDMQDAHVQETTRLIQENMHLRTIVYQLETENVALKGFPAQLPTQWTPLTQAPPDILPRHPALGRPSHHVQYTFAISTPATLKSRSMKSRQKSKADAKPSQTDTKTADDKGDQFCQLLEQQLCDDTIQRLLSDPLFDDQGKLLDTDVQLPIALTSITDSAPCLTASQVWQRLRGHPQCEALMVQELCQIVKPLSQYSQNGPVVLESHLDDIFRQLDALSSTTSPAI